MGSNSVPFGAAKQINCLFLHINSCRVSSSSSSRQAAVLASCQFSSLCLPRKLGNAPHSLHTLSLFFAQISLGRRLAHLLHISFFRGFHFRFCHNSNVISHRHPGIPRTYQHSPVAHNYFLIKDALPSRLAFPF